MTTRLRTRVGSAYAVVCAASSAVVPSWQLTSFPSIRLMQDNLEKERLSQGMEIRALHNQINAHFIYNVLEAIKMMAEIDEEYEIADAVTSLLHRVEVEKYGLCLKPTMTFDERGHQPGVTAYRVWGAMEDGTAPQCFLARTCDFVGQGTYDWPEALVRPGKEYLTRGDHAQGGEMTAVLFFEESERNRGQQLSAGAAAVFFRLSGLASNSEL